MTLSLFDSKGTRLDQQRFTWRELVQKPISKLDDDGFTRVRVILMNGIETEKRTSVPQSLHAILIAELADYDSWELLIKLADDMGQQDMASQFRQALDEERQHLDTVRGWVEQAARGALQD